MAAPPVGSLSTILIEFPGHGGGRLFDPDARDAVLQPFIYLRERLRRLGYTLETADDRPVAGCARVILWDFREDLDPPSPLRRLARAVRRRLRPRAPAGVRPLYAQCVRAGLADRAVLITGEPPVVLPANWDPRVHARFGTILTWNDAFVDGRQLHKFFWPVTAYAPETPPVPFGRKKLLVSISGNKTSSHPKELYSARRATIRHFERRRPAEFDLYGAGWEPGGSEGKATPSYRGAVRHKWEIYPRYRFGLCYENMRDEPGWTTEKIFDCMRADCVPIYWGASNVSEYVDPEAFVDRRRFASDADLEHFLADVTEADYRRYREAIRSYLAGERFAKFLPPAFSETLVRVLGLEGGARGGRSRPRA